MTQQPKQRYVQVPEDTVYLLLGILRLEKDGVKTPMSNINTALNELKECSRPAPPADVPKFNSGDLLLLAHDEWKRREERKHNHDMRDWEAGFINGFLMDKKWAREYMDKLHTTNHREHHTTGGDSR